MQFVAFLRSIGTGDELVYKAELIFGELLGNVVRHAPGPVEISFDVGSDAAILHVIDSGPEFPVNQAHLPTTCSVSSDGGFSSCNNSPLTCVSNVFPAEETTRS
jgi:anti-sigma regulatory factor (Ser/Thr protein kinase)